VLSLLARVPAWVWVVLALGAWGGYNRYQALALRKETAEQRVELASAKASVKQAKTSKGISDDHAAKSRAVDRRAAAVGDGLRALPQAARDPAAAAQCRDHEVPASVVSRRALDDLVDLARRADDTAEALSSCQAWVRSITQDPEN
jgi:hypothetical protein